MDWLKEIFPDATDEQMKSFKKHLGESFIPKDDYRKTVDGLRQELTTTQEALSSTSDKLKGFDGLTGENEKLKNDLTSLKTELDTFKSESESRLQNTNKKYALEKALIKANAHKDSVDLLLNDFDLEKVQLDDSGSIIGVDDILKPVMDKRSGLFAKQTVDTDPPKTGDGGRNTDDAALWAAIGVPKPN